MRVSNDDSPRAVLPRTPFDLLLAGFMVTAAMGVWAAYDRELAGGKFGMLVAAVAVYYLLALQPPARAGWAAAALTVVAAGISLYFLLVHDWNVMPADIGLLNRLALAWMALRPPFTGVLNHNLAGGVLALLAPYALALILNAWRARRWAVVAAGSVLGGVILAGELLASSRGAMLALAVSLSLWAVWGLCGPLAGVLRLSRRWLFGGALAAAVTASVALIGLLPGGWAEVAHRLLGSASGAARVDLVVNTFHLATDFLFTGGGLRAFEGLYSRYAMVIQVPLFTYGHNLYLDVLLEQGVFGWLALVGMLLGALGRLGRAEAADPRLNTLRWATAVSVIVALLDGVVDDALYQNAGTPLLFVWAGMAVAVTGRAPHSRPAPLAGARRWIIMAAGAAAVALVLVARPVLAAVCADLGAVQMARAELAGWPERGQTPADLTDARLWLERALQLEPAQPVAQHRLGLLALNVGDYAEAVALLERAYQATPGDRGVRKNLGYAYAWLGDAERAAPLLAGLPEASGELETYAWWWGTQARPDLSRYATAVGARLAALP